MPQEDVIMIKNRTMDEILCLPKGCLIGTKIYEASFVGIGCSFGTFYHGRQWRYGMDGYSHPWLLCWLHFVKWCRILFCFVWYIKNNAKVTVNNNFWVRSEAICQSFWRVTKSRVKIFGKSLHEWPKKSLVTIKNVLLYFSWWRHQMETFSA